jgi:predicted dehydrogenase
MAVVRFGLIGAGRWGAVYIRTILPLGDRCRITHLCTSRPHRAKLIPHPVAVVSQWHDVIASPETDAVIIATPPHTHAEILGACMDAGKPCIVEKPLCLDVATTERLHERIRSSRIPILVDHTHLFSDSYRTLKRAIGEAGEPIRLILSEGMDLGPFRPGIPALWDWGPHDLSLCLDLLGNAPKAVVALGGPQGSSGFPELFSIRLEFPNGVAWIQAGGLSPWKRRTLSVFTDTRLYLWDDLAAQQPTVSLFPFANRYAEEVPEALQRTPLAAPSGNRPMANMVTYFLDGLAGGDRRLFGAGTALEIARVLSACEAAMRRGAD